MVNILKPEDIEWKYVKHITLTTKSHTLFRDERFKIQLEQVASRDRHGITGKPKNYFFIDKVNREFTDVESLCECWNERHNFDNPNNETTWVKKVVPIVKLKTTETNK